MRKVALLNTRRPDRDAVLIYVAGLVRSATVSLVGVTPSRSTSQKSDSATRIGLLIGVGLAGSSLATVALSLWGDSWGRRRVLVVLPLLGALGYGALSVFTNAWALVLPAFFGMLNGMGRDRGAASALEQAILPQTVPADRRTWALAWCNLVLDCGHALGALAATGPTILANTVGLTPDVAHRATFALCAVAMLSCLVSYMALTPRIEISTRTGSFQMASRIGASSRRMITRLALLFGLDSIGGGFLNSALVAYWFFRRYGTSEADLAILFFAARSLNALPLCSVNASGDEARGRASSRVPRIIDYWTRSSPEDRGAADCLRQRCGRTPCRGIAGRSRLV